MAVTPNRTTSSIGQPLPVIIEFSSNVASFNMTLNKTFTYLPNPEITSLYPDSFIVTYVKFVHYNKVYHILMLLIPKTDFPDRSAFK